MKEVKRISLDSLCEVLFALKLDSDVSLEGHYWSIPVDSVDEFKDDIGKGILGSPECTETSYICSKCKQLYDDDNFQDMCDDCLDDGDYEE
ncbi:hypothetical protein GOV12_03815 [Candidatus Pacearchaeota archaeon]|nr:hypothetical protein [Candidatus Pacearchaeota archaeon]